MKSLKLILSTFLILLTYFSCSKDNPTEPKSAVLKISKESLLLSNEKNEDFLVISNDGKEKLSWNINKIPDWLQASPKSGVITTIKDTIIFIADIDKELGKYNGIIKISSNGGEKEISVTLIINPSIYPAVGAAGINIGDTFSKIIDLYGNPSQSGIFVDSRNNVVATWANYSSEGIWFIFHPSGFQPSANDKVTTIWLESPFAGVTEKNIGIGSSISEVVNSYGQPEEADNNVYRYQSLGINFKFENDKVITISIYKN